MTAKCISFLFVLLQADLALSAEINVRVSDHINQPVAEIAVDGDFSEGDSDRLSLVLRNLFSKGIAVERISLRSNGGLVSEGIEIGLLAREFLIETEAPMMIDDRLICRPEDHAKKQGNKVFMRSGPCMCASACALAWFGGIRRIGAVGVHRSFIPQSEEISNYKEYSKLLDVSHSQIEEYLQEIRIPASIIEKTLATDSRAIKFFEASFDGVVPIEDRIFQEYMLSLCSSPLTPFEKEELVNLSVANFLGEPLSDVDAAKLAFLDGKSRSHAECYIDAVSRARDQVQFE